MIHEHESWLTLSAQVDRAVAVMSDLIGTHVGLLEPTYFAIKRFELSFYRNQGASCSSSGEHAI